MCTDAAWLNQACSSYQWLACAAGSHVLPRAGFSRPSVIASPAGVHRSLGVHNSKVRSCNLVS